MPVSIFWVIMTSNLCFTPRTLSGVGSPAGRMNLVQPRLATVFSLPLAATAVGLWIDFR
jgi:hypothetical protein